MATVATSSPKPIPTLALEDRSELLRLIAESRSALVRAVLDGTADAYTADEEAYAALVRFIWHLP